MRRRCLVLAAAALVAAGCGSKKPTASHRTATRTTTATPATASPTDCNALGINPIGMREGTCTHAGITYRIMDENHALKLRTLTARLRDVRTVTDLVGGARPATAQGRFVVASILLTNRLELPQRFDGAGTRQAGLILDGTVYPEDLGVERASDPNSCRAVRVPIGPGMSIICQVVFDVPTRSAADLAKHGRSDLYLVDFGSDLSSSIPPQTVGQIRLYH